MTDALHRRSTIRRILRVSAKTVGRRPTPTIGAPVNQTAPSVTGVAMQGDALTAVVGAWSGNPTSYLYQWQSCATAATPCVDVAGATLATYTVPAAAVGHTLRVAVTARNPAGATTADSAPTATVTGPPPPAAPQTLNCYASPAACGYPSSSDVGAGDCAALPALNTSAPPAGTSFNSSTGVLTVDSPGVTLANVNLGSAMVYVSGGATGFTLSHSCMIYNGDDNGQSTALIGSSSATGMKILNSTIMGANATTEAVGELVDTPPDSLLDHDLLENTSDAVGLSSGGTISSSYLLVNATPPGAHDEDVYFTESTVTITGSTLLNTQYSTATVFGDTYPPTSGACENHLTMTDNLVAGGGYMIYPCANSTSVGSSTMNLTDNDFARCLGKAVYQPSTGGQTCGSVNYAGADSHGIWPHGGYFGIFDNMYCPPTAGQTYAGNHWDDTGAAIACSA